MNASLPAVGGVPVQDFIPDELLTFHMFFRRRFRIFLRKIIVRTVAITVTQPILVVMYRKIAYTFATEIKQYPTCVLTHIWKNEGISALFTGLVPTLLSCYYKTLVRTGIDFVLDRFIFKKKESVSFDSL